MSHEIYVTMSVLQIVVPSILLGFENPIGFAKYKTCQVSKT